MSRMCSLGFVSICLSLTINLGNSSPCRASDWGYDSSEPPKPKAVEEQSAASLTKSLLKPKAAPKPTGSAATKTAPGKSQPGKAGAPTAKTSAASSSPSKERSDEPFSGQTDKIKPDKVNIGVTRESSKDPTTPQTVPNANPFSRALKKGGGSAAGASSDSTEAYADKDMQAARCWLQLFQACSKQAMDYGDQKRMEAYVLGRERQGGKAKEEFRAVLTFWPKLIDSLHKNPELEMHYADLFKALLRLHEHNATEKTNVEGSPFSSDADMVSELLGMQRIAVDDKPPFTEDAVNAYADMAVFIYEQQHAGKTIDANDNRTLFAKVVVEKFNRAPTEADRRAMASFDLAWAKFKVIWFSSNEQTRKILLDKLVNSGANSSLTVAKDPLLDLVLSNWPWKTTP